MALKINTETGTGQVSYYQQPTPAPKPVSPVYDIQAQKLQQQQALAAQRAYEAQMAAQRQALAAQQAYRQQQQDMYNNWLKQQQEAYNLQQQQAKKQEGRSGAYGFVENPEFVDWRDKQLAYNEMNPINAGYGRFLDDIVDTTQYFFSGQGIKELVEQPSNLLPSMYPDVYYGGDLYGTIPQDRLSMGNLASNYNAPLDWQSILSDRKTALPSYWDVHRRFMGTMPGEIRLDKINRMNEIDAFMDTGTEGWAYYAPPEEQAASGGGGYGGYSYPSYGGYNYPSYDYPSYDYPEQAQNWYENMLQWKID